MESKEIFLRIWEREFQTTVRVFKAFSADQLEFKAHERSRSVRDLAWQCVTDEGVIARTETQNDLRNIPLSVPPPGTMEEIVAAYETAHAKAVAKVSQFSEEEFNRIVSCILPGGEWKMSQPEAFWGNLMDEVHHRGQLTVYLRLAGGKVPSIYGPSGDEAPPGFAGA
ncbi:MAG: DinB family protein [Terriglobia bacterium]|jgi:uncharacterized damage-inducible protein DinB